VPNKFCACFKTVGDLVIRHALSKCPEQCVLREMQGIAKVFRLPLIIRAVISHWHPAKVPDPIGFVPAEPMGDLVKNVRVLTMGIVSRVVNDHVAAPRLFNMYQDRRPASSSGAVELLPNLRGNGKLIESPNIDCQQPGQSSRIQGLVGRDVQVPPNLVSHPLRISFKATLLT